MSCPNHAPAEESAPCARCGIGYCDDCLVTLRNERLCGTCKSEVLRDVVSGTVANRLRLAPVTTRFTAWLIDRFMVWIGQLLALGVGMEIASKTSPYHTAVRAVLQLGVASFFFLYEGGKTLGKLALRIRVVRPDGTTIRQRQAWIRAAVRLGIVTIVLGISLVATGAGAIVSALLALGDYTPGLITQERTAIHDLIAGTRVVRDAS